MTLTTNELVKRALDAGASDIHIVCGLPVKCRVDGSMVSLTEDILTHEDCEGIASALAGEAYKKIERIGELDFAVTFPCGARTRVNVFRQQGHASAAIRILRDKIPQIEDLSLPPAISLIPGYRSGLVLVTGETGSGKSTTLAAVLDRINRTRNGHIITLEDPIEYIYHPQKCVVNQREIGRDTASYSDGLRAILREDPDIILIGEMRDLDTIEAALTAAETGHLVFATLHTNSAADSIDRIVGVFPAERQQQVRIQLAATLRIVLSQQLLPKIESGRAAACEVMVVTAAIRNLILEGKTAQINSYITMGVKDGSQMMDSAIRALLDKRLITEETALQFARDRDSFGKQPSRGGMNGPGMTGASGQGGLRRPVR